MGFYNDTVLNKLTVKMEFKKAAVLNKTGAEDRDFRKIQFSTN